jgi:hypothetical protein
MNWFVHTLSITIGINLWFAPQISEHYCFFYDGVNHLILFSPKFCSDGVNHLILFSPKFCFDGVNQLILFSLKAVLVVIYITCHVKFDGSNCMSQRQQIFSILKSIFHVVARCLVSQRSVRAVGLVQRRD